MFKKILIANRGEIACRVIETAKKLGISTVAVYSDADKHSKHVSLADERFHIGGPLALDSYLNSEKILQVARLTGAEAIHPGYGFLSENQEFATNCAEANVKFIGPSPEAMAQMASKSDSKRIMESAKNKVPVTPGYHGENQDPEFLLQKANEITYPVIIKAVMGGGGKGMKICYNDSEFRENLPSAQREALKSFKDERVLIEKYIVNPKHIEVQVFGDDHGNYVHLFERDCSIQRRHQKVIEEAPSALDENLRQEICNAAVEAARAVNYVNAGTVEFIFDLDTNKYYFMEMNTRLQVEHPISEMITGQDFVEWQLLVAKGHKLPLAQKEIERNGHAIEARIYSEDPMKFLPGRGTVQYYNSPTENVRIDSGVQLGSEVGIFYDPMISKLIVHGETRDLAVQKMAQALKNYKVGGLVTNIPLLSRILKTDDFARYDYDLKFIEKHMDPNFKGANLLVNHHWGYSDLQSLALLLFNQKVNDSNPGLSVPDEFMNMRINSKLSRTTQVQVKWAYSYTEDVLDLETEVTQTGANLYDIRVKILNQERNSLFANPENEFVYENVHVVGGNGKNSISIDSGKELFSREYFWSDNNLYLFNEDGSCFEVVNMSDKIEVSGEEISSNEANIKATMPGVVVKVNFKPGDAVKKGDVCVILEAMKMENMIKANKDGIVEEVLVRTDQFVEAGTTMVKFVEEKA